MTRLLFSVGLIISGIAFASWSSYGQVQHPPYTSPPASVTATIGGQQVTVAYYAPSAHGRKIMGGLVPFGEVWCTGANYATKITTESDLQLGGLKLPKGAYSIWTIPNEKEWTLIINK